MSGGGHAHTLMMPCSLTTKHTDCRTYEYEH